jgi:hypothetical protein
MGRGHRGLNHGHESWGLSPEIELQLRTSHDEYIMVGPMTVAPVMRSTSWWVKSVSPVTRSSHEEHQEHSHYIAAMKIGSFHFANSGRTS